MQSLAFPDLRLDKDKKREGFDELEGEEGSGGGCCSNSPLHDRPRKAGRAAKNRDMRKLVCVTLAAQIE